MRHVSTIELFELEEQATTFIIRRNTLWQEGKEEWRVWVDEHGIRQVVEGQKYHEIVKRVQEHLMK